MNDKKPHAGTDTRQEESAALASAFAEASKQDRERLAKIVDLLPCYVVIINKERRITFYNKAFEQYFGKPGDRACHMAMRGSAAPCRFCPPFDRGTGDSPGVMDWVQPGTGTAFRVHSHPFTEADGSISILKAGYNVTSTMRVQQALDLSEQSYRAITDNLSIGIALVDPHLRIKAGNIRLSQWFSEGFRLDRPVCELLQCGEFCKSAAVDLDFACPDCPFQASVADGASHEKELTVTLADGKERVMRMVTCPVKPGKTGRSSQVRALILMLEDITNRLRVNQQLQRARKLEAMSTLAGGIAHEINQPLSALHLYASGLQMLLEKQNELPRATTEERLSLIMREADKIRGIISHMRALVMQEGRVPMQRVALRPVLDSTLALMRQRFEDRKVRLTVDVPDNLPDLHSNDLQLEQVLINLLANALHALDSENASHAKHPPLPPAVLIRAQLIPELGRVRLEVADSGPGLPKGSERIFDPFYTTKERHEGMGLGLSIVHGLVSLWGGEISARPRHATLGGAAFYVDLPLARNDTAQASELSASTSAGKSAGPGFEPARQPVRQPGVQPAPKPVGPAGAASTPSAAGASPEASAAGHSSAAPLMPRGAENAVPARPSRAVRVRKVRATDKGRPS